MKNRQILEWVYPDKNLYQDVDLKNLESDLKKYINGEVKFDKGYRALYATDASIGCCAP